MQPAEIILENIACECGAHSDEKILTGRDWLNNLPEIWPTASTMLKFFVYE